MTTTEALSNIFKSYSNDKIAKITGMNYNTVTSWKFNFKRNELSLEKQIEILTKLNYKPITNLTWTQN
jgi:transposase